MNKVLLLSLFAVSGISFAQDSFKLSDLVIPQGVSYTLGPVTLTRTLENMTSTSASGTSSSNLNSSSSSAKTGAESSSGSNYTSRFSKEGSIGGSIGGSTGGSEKFSLLGLLSGHVDVSGKVSYGDSSERTSTSQTSRQAYSETSAQASSGATSESADVEQYGDYHLMFSIIFKSKDFTDKFLIGGPNSRVVLEGFSREIEVPYLSQEPVLLGAEKQVCFFDYPIKDRVILNDAKRMVSQGRRNAVTLALTGSGFPAVSERTKKNVISETALLMRSPNTVVSVDFGDVNRLSPWRVRQKFPRSYGRLDQRVTIHDALDALNVVIAEDEEMPEKTFVLDENGYVSAIEYTSSLPEPSNGDISLIAVNCIRKGHDADVELRLPTSRFLSEYLSNYSELHFVQISLLEVAQINTVKPGEIAPLVKDIIAVLPGIEGGEKLWKELCAKCENGQSGKSGEKEDDTAFRFADAHKAGEKMSIDLSLREKMDFCFCPSGRFQMGSPKTDDPRDDDETLHEVTISKGFWMGRTEVTQGQWREIMGMTVYDQAKKMLHDETEYNFGSLGKKTLRELLGFDRYQDPKLCCAEADDDVPVYYVNYEEAREFCARLTERERKAGRLPGGWSYRLPTESEWEYACRAGTDTPLPNGKRLDAEGQNNAPNLSEIAWYGGNSMLGFSGRSPWNSSKWPEMENHGGPCGPRRVATRKANNWGLYDMNGNVWEWCLDWYGDYPASSVKDPCGAASGGGRVFRGGGWRDNARYCRSSDRDRISFGYRNDYLGFRVCCSAEPLGFAVQCK